MVLAGQGRDTIEGGAGDDFIDGGSESDFLATLTAAKASGSAIQNQLIVNPDSGKKSLFSIYDGGVVNSAQVWWAWDDNKVDPTYFKVAGNTSDGYKAVVQTIDANFYNDRFSQYDEAIYSGSQLRYSITEVYLKMKAGQPDFDTSNNYQVKSLAEYAALSDATEKGKYTKVVQIKDVLPDAAGGTGTDYLLNIEEVRFEDGKEQLEIDSFAWPEISPISANWGWQPASGAAVAVSDLSSYSWAYGGTNTAYQAGQWKVYDYGTTLADGTTKVYAVINTNWNGLEALVVVDSGSIAGGDAQFKEATDTKYSGSSRGTIKDDIMGHAKNPSKMQDDEIFGKAGNDLIIAGAGVDRIKGGSGDDTIWGGTNTGAASWMFDGDTAFFAGSLGRYDVIQNVYVKAASENGALDRDASGNVIVYRANNEAFVYKGVTDGGFADVDGLAASQTVSSGTTLDLSGGALIASGTATFASGRVVTIKSAGDDSGITFTVAGTNEAGASISDVITGANIGVATGGKYFATVTSITTSDAAAGAVEAGINWNVSTTQLTTANGFYEAVIVVDSLSESQNGDGTDVLVGVEGLMFGSVGSGEHEWLQVVEDMQHGHAGMQNTGGSLTKLKVSVKGEDYHRDWSWNEGDPDGVLKTGGTVGSLDGDLVSGGTATFTNYSNVSITRTNTSAETTYTVAGTGDHDWNSGTADQNMTSTVVLSAGMSSMSDWKQFKTVTSVTKVGSSDDGDLTIGTSGGMAEVVKYTVKYTGTDFDDIIYWDEASEFKTDQGTKFTLSQAVEMYYDGGLGDDIIYGSTPTKDGADSGTAADTPNLELSYVTYTASKAEYDITLNRDGSGDLESVTVKHKVANSMGGTGTDTLYDIDGAKFGSGSTEEVNLFTPTTESMKEFNQNSGQEEVTGYLVKGTEYNETVLATNYDDNVDQTIFFAPKGSYNGSNENGFDTFTGRSGGNDGIELSGIFSRYDIKFDDSNDTWTITDLLPRIKGGDGVVKATDIEKINFMGPFDITIGDSFAGQKGGDSTTAIKLNNENPGYSNAKYTFGIFSALAGDGALLTDIGADPNGIAASQTQTTASATNLVLDGALDTGSDDNINLFDGLFGKYITVTSASGSDDSGITFTVTGTNMAGASQTDIITGADASSAAATAYGSKMFKTVTEVKASDAAAGNVEVGVMNRMSDPSGYETVNHDGNDGTSAVQITPQILFGNSLSGDGYSLLATIDSNSDGNVSNSDVDTARSSGGSFTSKDQGGFLTLHTQEGSFNASTGMFEYGGSNVKVQFDFQGMGNDDTFYGGDNNDHFYGAPGNDVFWGRGEEKAEWWDTFNSGDRAQYDGVSARYTISAEQTDVNASDTITVSSASAINVSGGATTVSVQKDAATAIVFTAVGNGASGLQFDKNANEATTATNLAAAINAHADFTAAAAGVVVTVSVTGGGNVFITSTDAAKLTSSNTWDNTGITVADFDTWVTSAAGGSGSVHTAPKYFTVTDSLDKIYGGDGVDYLVDIEKIKFTDKTYSLEIQTIKNDWDSNTTILGTSGNDAISGNLTDDSASDKDFQINTGAGNDLIVGGIEPTGQGWVWGDTAVIDAQAKYFDISIEELYYALNGKVTVTTNANTDGVLTIGDTVNSLTVTEGTDWTATANNASTSATALAAFINANGNFSASATGAIVTITAANGRDVSVASTEATKLIVGTGSVYSHNGYDWDGDAGSADSDDTSLANTLHTRFGGTTVNKITVKDNRPDDAGGLGTDTMYGIEHIEFRSGEFGEMFDLSPSAYRGSDGNFIDFWGTNFGDVFNGDDGSTWINAQGGDDWIIAGNGADKIQAGAGADYIHGGAHSNGPSGDSWFRDEANFWETPYGRTEVSQIKVQVHDTTSALLLNADGTDGIADDQFLIFGYTGSAAYAEDYEENVTINSSITVFDGTTVTSGYTWTDAFLVTDTLPMGEIGSIGVNVLVDIEAIGFSDEFLDVKPSESSWSYVDWEGNTISESFKEGTPFDDSISGGSGADTLSGESGHDILSSAGGGDRLKGGKGNDILDGGANGSSGDTFRDLDMAEYTGLEAQYGVFKVKVDDSSMTANATTIFDVSGALEAQFGLTDVNSNGTADTVVLDGYTVVRSSGTQGAMNDTAYIVVDFLPSAMGGSGNDLLINVEQVQFQNSSIDLGLRIDKNNWDGDTSNGYEWVEVVGTDGADDITAWGSGTDLDGASKTTTTSNDVTADNEIRGKGGNDIIFGYAGGDRISGGSGDDFIDGGADGVTQYGWTPKDEALYSGQSKNYTITTYSKTDTALTDLMTELGITVSNWSNYADTQQFVVVKDSLPGSMGGTGTDILTNVEFIAFQDQFLPLAKEEFIDVDPNTGLEVRRYVNGTSAADTIEGGVGNDDLIGNAGNDTIKGGVGGDFINPGKGDDTIDGGADGTNQWDGSKIFDTVIFEGNFADFEIEDSEVDGTDSAGNAIKILQITVTDPSPGGQGTDTIINAEILQFNDQTVFVGMTESQREFWNGNEFVKGGSDIYGSIFGDTIQGTASDDAIDGGKGADTIYGNNGPDWIKGGLGNDIIYGGKNGLDAWGNAGDDVAAYSGNQSSYTVTFYDSSGSTSTTYQVDGYVKVKDSRTDTNVSEGTDTLYGIEGIQFRDDYLGFQKVETFIDLDGDGKPDVGGKTGTSGADTLEGSKMDEKLEGKVGDDVLSGGGGNDTLIGGVGSDTLIGGNGGGVDTAGFEGNQANYTVANVNKWVAEKSDGTYETDASGNPKVYEHVHEDAANALLTSTTLSGAGTLTMNGALVSGGGNGSDDSTLNGGKFVTITGTGDNTGCNFEVTGTNAAGATITETITGVDDGTAKGALVFATVTEIKNTAASDGAVTVGADSFAGTGTSAKQGLSVTTKDADADGTISDAEKSGSDVVDYIFEMENLQFADGFGRTDKQMTADDNNFDFQIDGAEILGAIGADSFKADLSALHSILPQWVIDEEGSNALALEAVFAADNFFDGGAGRDDIAAGAGDDAIDPGARSGDANDVVDGGAGMDLLILSGASTNWTKATAGAGHTGTYNGYNLASFDKYTSTNGTTEGSSATADDFSVYVKGIEAIEYDDKFQSLETTTMNIDSDGDGKIDSVMVKGADAAEAVEGSLMEGVDKDSMFAAAQITDASSALTLVSGDDDGFFEAAAPNAGALTLSGDLVSSSVGAVGGKLVSIKTNNDADADVRFTITGTDLEGNTQTEVVTGADASTVQNTTKVFATVEKIVSSADAAGTISVGAADSGKLGDGQFVTIESAGNDAAVDFTITGKDANGIVMTEVISGTNVGEALGTKLFTEVTSIKASTTTAGTISVGTVSTFAAKEDFIDGGAGDDVISSGDGGDTLIGGAGSDFMFGGANTGTDDNGDPNKDVAKFNGRSTSVDLNGDGSISADESADFSIAQKGFVICNGIIDSNGVCILTTLSATTTAAVVAGIGTTSSAQSSAGNLTIADTSAVHNAAVTLTSAADDSAVTFTITGTDAEGATITEKITGGKAGAVTGSTIFKTVTKVASSAKTSGKVEIGKAAVKVAAEDRIGDNEIDATTKPTIFTNAETAIAVKVANGYDATGDGQEDTFEVAGSADGVSVKAALSGGGAQTLALTGSEAGSGKVMCVESKNVMIKSYGNDSSITFTVTGTDDAGTAITETITGGNAAVATGVKLFKTITEIKTSGDTASGGVEVGLTTFYLDIDGDQKADTLTSGKFQKDLNGDGKYTGTGEYEVALAADMTVDEIFVATLDANGDGDTTDATDISGHQIFDGHELRPVYEVTDLNNKDSSDNNIIDYLVEVEEFEFTDGKIKTGSETEESVTFSLANGVTEEVQHEGSNFADEIMSTAKTDVMEGGGGADEFVFGAGTGTDTVTDFVATTVKNDKGVVTSYADVIKVLKDVNGQSIDTASGLANRVTSTTNGALVDLGGGNTVLLEGVNSSDLTAANFAVVEVL